MPESAPPQRYVDIVTRGEGPALAEVDSPEIEQQLRQARADLSSRRGIGICRGQPRSREGHHGAYTEAADAEGAVATGA